MRKIVTISFTGIHASGGVPNFNRSLHTAFHDRETAHFCWTHFPWHGLVDSRGETEWGRAKILNDFLSRTRLIGHDDVIVADGFWAAGLEQFPFAVSHSHGIWSHLTHADVLAGKDPDMPAHHAAQVVFRKWWRGVLRKHMTAVSDFIAEQMHLQWGLAVDRVINNGVDTELYRPRERRSSYLNRPLVVHGVNDRSNMNKGWDHVALLKANLEQDVADVMSLDEAFDRFRFYSDRPWTKPEVLAQADLVVHPSGFEGNSMFVAEALSCGLPVVAYDVGALSNFDLCGLVMDRNGRSPQRTLDCVLHALSQPDLLRKAAIEARRFACEKLSAKSFALNWRSYVEEIENA